MVRYGLCALHLLLVSLLNCIPAKAAEIPTQLVFAYQPLASPGGALGATLKRDRILRQALDRAGLTLQPAFVSKGGEAISLLKAGSADIATLGDMPLIEAASAVPLQTIALVKQNYVSVVGAKGLFASDLKGRRIGNAYGTTGHFSLLKTLASGGLSEADVTLVPMEVGEMRDALLQNKIDAFAAWEPTPEMTISRYPDRFAAIGKQKSLAFIVVSRRLADKHPELSNHLAAALIRAMNWLRKDKEAVNRVAAWNLADIRALTGRPPQMTKTQLAQTIRKELAAIGHSPRMPREINADGSSLAEEVQFLKKLGKVPAATQWNTINSSFNFKVIEQVMKQPKAYQLQRFDYDRN